MAGFWENMFPGALGLYGYDKLQGDLSNQQNDMQTAMGGIRQDVNDSTQFQPWSVKSNVGTSSFDPATGGINMTPTGAYGDAADSLLSDSQNMFGRAMQDTAGREADIYERMRAVQSPEEERQRQQMAALAQSQGRGGIRSDQYGGTPEQLAFEKALGESKNSAMLGAMGQAQQEQMQQYNMGQGMFGSSFLPSQNLMQQSNYGINQAGLNQNYDLNRASLLAQLGLGEAGTNVNYDNIKQNMFGNMIGSLGGMAGGVGGMLDNALSEAGGYGGLWDTIRNSLPF